MNNDLEPTAPTAADTPAPGPGPAPGPAPAPAPASGAGQHVAALLSTSALPATTALLAAAGPKFPPFAGD